MATRTPHEQEALDRRYMAAAIRLSRKHSGLTSTNPAVGTLIVRDDGGSPVIVGRGVTAVGGRPHAETEALAEAGKLARGATAYVTLEPCAHHGRTPPCANALVTAGVVRVVGGASDPDERVSGKGYAILRQAGIEVVERVLAEEAADAMAGYLTRSLNKRPEVTLKLALSQDGMIGKPGEGQIAITGEVSRRQVHMMRAVSDAILVGIGTAIADDPELTVRLPGLASRSPARIVLDRMARLPLTSKLVLTARDVPLLIAACAEADPQRKAELERAGAGFLATETFDGRVALPELLEDLAAKGMASLLVEGGAITAKHFLDEGLVDRIVLFRGAVVIGEGGLAAPIDEDHMPAGFRLLREATYGDDRVAEWARPI
ncbi:bifunctional diaminohydroxyphosphoribosylaminopyrimidine deaminase/5-amino-6-(5-phosphoribosylamino)uracil reductase RibD [Mesorhizobium sp. KR9-304]|uniref:bifunctional diaminohydroxyphosphoribosylaminopyrimidine deaminase/5-amino-6-(5-phosphoribosylamino)uracil reductase RibD n=1 Tax=Mesorhizobium sp. KR9-304 TaxID=3156614 RepID=UPI0032B3BBA3